MDPALENVNVHGLHAVSDGCQEENRFSLHFHVPERLPAENRLLAPGRSAEIGGPMFKMRSKSQSAKGQIGGILWRKCRQRGSPASNQIGET
jgi:hypothetical protein